MYKRLIILSIIILSALFGLTWLGYHSIKIRAWAMESERLAEFAEVAEQIRLDIKRKLDDFIQTEQNRPYTDYQFSYVRETTVPKQQQLVTLRSPLADKFEHGFAIGNFQIAPDGTITTPYSDTYPPQENQQNQISNLLITNIENIKKNLLPVLNGVTKGSLTLSVDKKTLGLTKDLPYEQKYLFEGKSTDDEMSLKKTRSRKSKALPIESLQEEQQQAQVIQQKRSIVASNIQQRADVRQQLDTELTGKQAQTPASIAYEKSELNKLESANASKQNEQTDKAETKPFPAPQKVIKETPQQTVEKYEEETIPIRIEPFVPMIVSKQDGEKSVFAGQVFLLRHVQIEDKHFLQGFKLNSKALVEQVRKSASNLIREGMSFELGKTEDLNAAYTALLDFGFGNLVLNLKEINPGWISKEVSQLKNWYLSIIAIVFLAVILGLASLWRNMNAQLKLAHKKDDFLSAVSHELRTPLTSIRMYSEMLEKNWVKSQDKINEYHRNMRQESERLTRLIENVLDFSRIQRKRKKYSFTAGDINNCIEKVVKMMRPYASQNGFTIKTEFQPIPQTVFDNDAITQIAVNLLDNAIKYARNAKDKTIMVRTKNKKPFVLIEVEDHGPGIPHRQRKKIFEEFYRCEAEATRETAGTGLGLALVEKFAQAHNGFVEIATAQPTGSIFRVSLTTPN